MAKKVARREFLRWGGLAGLGAALAACKPETVVETVVKEVEKTVKETVIVEGTPKVVEKVITVVPTEAPVEVTHEELTLSVITIWGGSRVPLMEDMFERFHEEYPWLTVEHVLVPGGERLQKIQTGIAGGTPHDVVMVNQKEIPLFATRRALVPLDDYMQAWGISYDEYYETSIKSSQWQGKTYSLPNVKSTWHYFYNVDLYEKAELDPDQPPETWDELVEYSKKLTVWEGEFITQLGYQFYNGLPGLDDFKQALFSNQGEYFVDDGRQVAFNSQQGVEALEWLIYAMEEIYGSIEDYQAWGAVQGAEDITNPFIAGTCAAADRGVWDIYYIRAAETDLNYRIGLLPHAPGGKSMFSAEGNWSYGIPVGVQSVEDSWRLVEWLGHEPSASCWFMQQQGRPSPLRSCNEDDWYYEEFPDTWPDVVKAIDRDAYIPLTPANPEIQSVLSQAIEEAVNDVRKPKDALDWAAEEAQALLDEAWAESW